MYIYVYNGTSDILLFNKQLFGERQMSAVEDLGDSWTTASLINGTDQRVHDDLQSVGDSP